MSLTVNQIEQAAKNLLTAEETGQQIGLLSQRHQNMTMDDAYAVQKALVARKIANGRHKIGWKIGLTSRAMQMALNINIPDSGVLLDDMAFETGATIATNRFIQPRVEAEIAFVMKAPLSGENTTRADVIAATDYVVPSLEILDTRILRICPDSGKPRIITDTIADNAANAGIVLGAEKHPIDAFDLRWVGAIVSANNTVEETGLGAGVLNDPIEGIVWLARRMAQYNQCIEPKQVILSGSFIRPIESPPGTSIDADFGPFGSVNINFA